MTDTTWINGLQTASLDPRDRGLQYGDGLFETIAVFNGQPQCLADHLDRLQRSAARLKFPEIELAGLEAEIHQAAGDLEKAVLKLVITRGESARGYRPPERPEPTRIIMTSCWPLWPGEYYLDGVRSRVCEQRLAIQPALAGMKHLNRLEQVLARAEWTDPGIVEGVMLDTDDRLVCGTMSNLYLLSGPRLLTPSLERCGVKGVMRQQVQKAAVTLGLEWHERDLALEDALSADEMYFSNALIGLWPVRELDGHRYTRMDGGRRLLAALAAQGVRQCNVS
jgi:4-amino-4-deoxychorismate lyase